MPRRARIETDLPEEIRQWLGRELAEGNFAGYERLAALLAERGYTISKSAIHRYGAKLERKLAAIKSATEAAKLMADAAPDDQDARSGALTSMIQVELFETLVNLQEAADAATDPVERTKMLSVAAKNIATLTRSSVNLKRYQVEAEERTKRAAAKKLDGALKDAAVAGEKGLSAERAAQLRRDILGMSG